MLGRDIRVVISRFAMGHIATRGFSTGGRRFSIYNLFEGAPMDPTDFLTALAAIVMIDLVLAGDNAIVIALAARALPPHLQRRAILWGTVGAIAVRSAMTVVVVWLLKVPGLLLVGGMALVWIAYGLLKPQEGEDTHGGPVATTFWGAMRTIVIADAVMGLDNVLAVAGAAHGSYLLVVLGLLISIPIVVWGSTLVLKVVDRYPGVIYLGAAVLVWTAAKMVAAEPLIKPYLALHPLLPYLPYLAIPCVLWMGFRANHLRLESRIHTRLQAFAAQRSPASPHPALAHEGEDAMLKVLVPVDGTANAIAAIDHAIGEYRRHHELEIHLLNVQAPFSRHVGRFLARSDKEAYLKSRSNAALKDAGRRLLAAGVPYHTHWAVGDRARLICDMAKTLACHHIVMGTARKNSLTRMLEDSVTNQVLEHTPVPVEVVAGRSISTLERWGLPAGVSAALGLLWVAADA
jgi:YjbE family integral membrane protein